MSAHFYSVRIDGKAWTSDAVSVEWYESRGATVCPSRIDVGDFTVFLEGRAVGYLFASKVAAAEFVSTCQ